MNKEEVDKFCKEYYGYTIEESDKDIGYWMEKHHELQQENNQLKEQRQELRSWLEEQWEQSQDIWFVKIINKLNELEEDKNENI